MYYEIKDKAFIINDNFEIEYDNWNKIDREGNFLLGETSKSLQSIGLLKQKIYIDKSKLIKIRNKHTEMNDDLIKKIPCILDNPIIILKSQSIEGRIVIFSEIKDINNSPILVAMELNPTVNTNNVNKIYKVASAYGKANIKSLECWLKNKNNILYIADKKRINKWLSGLGLQLSVPLINNIDSCDTSISNMMSKNNIKINELPDSEQPRHRAIKYGVSYLSNEELIAIILKTGTKNCNVKMLSSKILSSINDIGELKDIGINTLTSINGIGKVKAIELLASLELGKRVYYIPKKDNIKLNNSKKIYEYFKDIFIGKKQENFYAVYLDTKSKLISYKLLFIGTLNSSYVHPREIFKYAMLESAASIIVMHNHPSGDTTPSHEDEILTYKLFEIGSTMGLPVVDHIIFGDYYYSFYESMHKNS